MELSYLTARREKLCDRLQNKEAVILFANTSTSIQLQFMQDNNFLYFTGLFVPDAVAVFRKSEGFLISTIYIPRNKPERIVWEGKKMLPAEATDLCGISNIVYVDEFDENIVGTLAVCEKIYVNSGMPALCEPMNRALLFANRVKKLYPHLQFVDMTDLIRPLRSVKDQYEIDQLQKAIDITGLGIENVMKQAHVGMNEYQMEAIIYYHMLDNGLRHWGFTPIIATGINAATLHYSENNTVIQENELILLDVGAACQNYSADVTRTFPVAEKFSDRQKEVYAEVLYIQKEIIAMIKPGIGINALNEKTTQLMQEALIRLKLIEDKKDFRKYYMHSISHHLGLNTHDVGARDSILNEGAVITVEPGIYIPEERIGVRIEDDVLVTKNGHRVLSVNIPKEINELEAIRQKALAK